MRGNPEAHGMVAPGTLSGVLQLISAEPGEWTPIAGGTELMVAHAAGSLQAQSRVVTKGRDLNAGLAASINQQHPRGSR